MSKLEMFIQANWPDAVKGRHYDVQLDAQQQPFLSVWSSHLGQPPTADELENWENESSPPIRPKLAETLEEQLGVATTLEELRSILSVVLQQLNRRNLLSD